MTGTTHVKGVQNRTTAHGFHCALEQISANEERLEHERTKQALAASKKDIVEKDELILTLKTTLRKLQETLRKKEKDVQTLFAVMRAPQDADLTKKNKQQLIERLIMELQQRVVNCEAVAEARRRELDKLKCSMRMSRNQELEVELEVCYAEIERLRARGGPAHSPVLRPGDAIVGKLRLSAAPADTRPPPKEPPTKKTPRTLSAEATMSSKGQRTGLSSTSSYTSERPQLVRELTATKKESFVSKTRRRAQDAEYLKQVRLAQLETECELEENLHIRAARELRARLAQEQATMKQKLEEQREVIINAQVNELQRLRDATKQQEAERQAAIAAEQATQEQALQMARAAAEAQRVALLDKQARAAQLIQRNWRIRLQRLAQASLKATRAKIEQIEKNVAASASLIQTWWRKKMEDVTAAIAAVAVPSKLVIAPKLDSSNTSDDDEKIGEEDGIEDDTAAVDNAVKPTKDAPAQNVDSLHVAVVKRYDDDEFDDDPEANDDDSIASDTSEPSRMSGKESHGSSGEGEEVAHHPVDIDEYADEKEEHTSETDELTDHKDEHVEASSPDKTTEAPIALTPEKHKQNHDGMEHTPTQGFNLDPHWSPQASQVAEPRASAMISCIAIVGAANSPLYIRTFEEDEDLGFHNIVHVSLDIVEEKVRSAVSSASKDDMYIGFLGPIEDYRAYAYVTNTAVKFIAVVQDAPVRENELRAFFAELHKLYINAMSNPFAPIGERITSQQFEKRVYNLVLQHNNNA
ncbi:TPA: hypothetical protein N0F65_008095 [Lagenidium giganteum]|uniref:Trafficking protein particle complex subunit 2-like protein n=1 Tax=Lagenidium giganteum TaxID=4803 RepID=A0AAV2YZJ3_9STRA|nr:TPA: hypothetical protein N0F65_008095 [Lagenidium giganteum]